MGLFIKIFFQILILIIILIYYFYPINSYSPFSDEIKTYKVGDGIFIYHIQKKTVKF